ncbi:MAG TPA: cupin domain-containing protein [Candidatus Methylomirabilis sp.]|nr:cupin domain-containing protein [Candidatus Methylomirabilis sp.]
MSSLTVAPPLAGNTMGTASCNFVIAEWRDAGGPAEPRRLIAPPHVHHKDDEAWYVLEGELRVQKGEEEVAVPAGAGVLVPRGTPHTYWNPGPGQARYLLIMTANIFQLIQDIHALKERTPDALQAVFRAHDSELVKM